MTKKYDTKTASPTLSKLSPELKPKKINVITKERGFAEAPARASLREK